MLHVLIKYNSINMIEHYRFGKNRRIYEELVINLSNQQNNQFMINYCYENDYGNH